MFIVELQTEIHQLQAQNVQMQNRITELERQVAKMKGDIESLIPKVNAELISH